MGNGTYLMLNYKKGEKLASELSNSNANHISRIVKELDTAEDSLEGITEANSISSRIEEMCSEYNEEAARYGSIAEIIYNYYRIVEVTDMELGNNINTLFEENHINKNYEFMIGMVREHCDITTLAELKEVADEYDLSIGEVTELVALRAFLEEFSKLSKEERKKQVENPKEIESPDPWVVMVLKNSGEILDMGSNINDVFGACIIANRGNAASGGKEIAVLENSIVKLQAKINKLSLKITPYTTADGRTMTRINNWKTKVNIAQGKMDAFKTETNNIKAKTNSIGKIIIYAQIGSIIISNGYDNSTHGMDIADFIEDIAVDIAGIGISVGAGGAVGGGTSTVLAGIIGTAAGPVGTVVGVAVGTVVGIAYESLKDEIHNTIDDIKDWWEQCWW